METEGIIGEILENRNIKTGGGMETTRNMFNRRTEGIQGGDGNTLQETHITVGGGIKIFPLSKVTK